LSSFRSGRGGRYSSLLALPAETMDRDHAVSHRARAVADRWAGQPLPLVN
jgi:hypothetical protein